MNYALISLQSKVLIILNKIDLDEHLSLYCCVPNIQKNNEINEKIDNKIKGINSSLFYKNTKHIEEELEKKGVKISNSRVKNETQKCSSKE